MEELNLSFRCEGTLEGLVQINSFKHDNLNFNQEYKHKLNLTISIVGHTEHTKRGGESVCVQFITFQNLIIIIFQSTTFINTLSTFTFHKHILITSSSHKKHTQYTICLHGNPSTGGKAME